MSGQPTRIKRSNNDLIGFATVLLKDFLVDLSREMFSVNALDTSLLLMYLALLLQQLRSEVD